MFVERRFPCLAELAEEKVGQVGARLLATRA